MINYKHDKDEKKPYYGTPENERFWDDPKNPNPNAKMSVVGADFLNSVNSELRELVKLFGLTLGSDPLEGQLAKFLKPFWQREQQTVGSILTLAYEPKANGDGSFPIQGYLPCQGAAVSRTTYAKLFAAIGETYGKGDGTTTFNVPDLRGMFLRGHDGADGFSGGWGKKQEDAIQNITGSTTSFHSESNISDSGALYSSGIWSAAFKTDGSGIHRVRNINFDASRVVRTSNETRPMNYCVFYCIKHGEFD